MSQKIRQDIPIGNTIRIIRKSKHMTQEAVVAKLQSEGCNISRSIYSQIECGTYNIRASELIALAKIYNVKIDDFFN